MQPSLPSHNVANRGDGHPESVSKLFVRYSARRVEPPDFQHLGIRQDCTARVFPARTLPRVKPRPVSISKRRAPLHHHVRDIVLVRSKKKMIWVATQAVITRMANEKLLRAETFGQRPSDSMCGVCCSGCYNTAITIVALGSRFPLPALTWTFVFDANPKVARQR